jgi:LmbE family N-acetylglucosaminyl deacetylase
MGFQTDGDLGDVLGVWAHPDDEAWLSAGVMMRAVAAGRRVVCVTATKGEAGFPEHDRRTPQQRMDVREAELADCLAILGVTEHRYLGYGDGQCARVPDSEGIDRVAAIIAEIRPDTILSFGPDGGTGHSDHVSTCRWATEGLAKSGRDGVRLLYSTKTRHWQDRFFSGVDPSTVMMIEDMEPEAVEESALAVWFTCDDDLVARKVAAMRAQASQIEPFVEMVGIDGFTELVREEFFRDPAPEDADILDRMTRLGRP